ncbi:MAG: MFS transporter [Promethearchaeota archaeon]|nr:MAG: MFS transporter [Candidatus Lokiarchaeota archaeon]
MSEKKNSEKKQFSIWIHFSFNLVMVMLPATYGLFSTQFFYFYETVIKLDVIFVGAANVIFLIWDSINDPIIGFLSDRKSRFTKKYGRRFPFIIIFGIPTLVSLILLFLPLPVNAELNPWPVFLWILIWLFIHEFSYTAVSLTRALFPEKFRSDKERRKNAGIGIITYNLGLFIGLIIPFIFITEESSSFLIASLILALPCLLCFFLGIPGIREEPDMIKRALEVEKEPFITTMKKALKKRNFVVFTFVNITIQLFAACILASINYWVEAVLLLPKESPADVILMILWFLAGLGSIILWIKIASKFGHKNTQVIGLIAVFISIIPILFVRSFLGAIISFTILGVAAGANTFVKYPIFGDIIDEITIEEKKRQEGIYQGVLVFFDRIGILFQPIIFTIVHIITNYNPNTPANQTFLAQQGIIAAMTWIPAIFLLIAAVIFWKYYDLTTEKSVRIKEKLEELQL